MGNEKFEKVVKEAVSRYVNERLDKLTEKRSQRTMSSSFGLAIDIMPDNVLERRARLYKQFQERFPAAGYEILLSAASILAQNIICGDGLKIMKGWEEDEKSCCCSNI